MWATNTVLCPPAMKADRKRLKGEKTDLVSQMQQLYATLESREEQLRDFIRNYEQHRKVGPLHPPPSTGSSLLALQTQTTAYVPFRSLGEAPCQAGPGH